MNINEKEVSAALNQYGIKGTLRSVTYFIDRYKEGMESRVDKQWGRFETSEKLSFLHICHSERSEESSVVNITKILRFAQDDRKVTFSMVSDGSVCLKYTQY